MTSSEKRLILCGGDTSFLISWGRRVNAWENYEARVLCALIGSKIIYMRGIGLVKRKYIRRRGYRNCSSPTLYSARYCDAVINLTPFRAT
jgi:hypothetical protein